MQVIAGPVSRQKLREFAEYVRKRLELHDVIYFPIINVLENVLPIIYPEYSFEVGTMGEMGNLHGITLPDKGIIRIREDVYEGATQGNGRDRFTCAHELGHFLMHDKESVRFARSSGEPKKIYMDPEWQADAFAGELLVPAYKLPKNKKPHEISILCGVTRKAAEVQCNKMML